MKLLNNLSTLIVLIFLLFQGCDKKPTESKPNQPPVVSITNGPTGTVTNNSVTFTWNGNDSDGSISGYYYDIDDSSPDEWTTQTSKTLTVDEGSHTFYIKAKDDKDAFSEIVSRSFQVSIIPSAPNLIQPSNGSTIDDDTPLFNWNNPTYAHQFELLVDNSNSFTSPEILQTNLSSSNYTPSSGLNNDKYYWKVRAKNNSGMFGDWSSIWSFTISVGSSILFQRKCSEFKKL